MRIAAAVLVAAVMLSGCGGTDSATGPPGDDADGAEPAGYSVTVDAAPAGEAPFEIAGSRATVAADADSVPVQLTLTSNQHLLLDDVRWRFVNDERDPDLAVAGPHCGLTREADRAQIGCKEVGRLLTIRPDQPLREELTVFLPATDPVGTYDYIQSVEWWHGDADTGRTDLGEVEDQPADGHVDVKVRVRVQATPETPQPGAAEPDHEGEESWGPLAVEPPEAVTETALLDGATVRITDECVFMADDNEKDERTLLVWPADRTTWNEDTATITYENSDGSVTIADGDRLNSVGGYSHFESFQELVASIEWVSPPAEACRTTTFWDVGGITKEPAR